VKRSWAVVLLAIFSFSLISPAVFAAPDAKLPSCCARGGKHHCSTPDSSHSESSGPAARGIQQRCPYYPSGAATPVHSFAAIHAGAMTFYAALVSHPAAHAQTAARYRISFSRSSQKRGPPSLSC
jgi:hypothetical protein